MIKKRLRGLLYATVAAGVAATSKSNLNLTTHGTSRHMGVSIRPTRRAGSWGYLTESWKEDTLNFNVILISIREN